jgi:hypothetical protein
VLPLGEQRVPANEDERPPTATNIGVMRWVAKLSSRVVLRSSCTSTPARIATPKYISVKPAPSANAARRRSAVAGKMRELTAMR